MNRQPVPIRIGAITFAAAIAVAAGNMLAGSEQGQTLGSLPTKAILFDDLDGGSPLIQVYPGPSERRMDRTSVGVFRDGDTALADCWTEGRLVNSHPELGVGEREAASSRWLHIILDPRNNNTFATATYLRGGNLSTQELNRCPKNL